MLVVLVSFAYGFGLVLSRIGFPPMVGFLLAGFVFNLVGLTPPSGLKQVADLGIILLLFSIGLKLDIRDLLKPEIWVSSTAQMILTTIFFCGILALGRSLLTTPLLQLSWSTMMILAFALAFSSTVFAVKVLEEKGDMTALYGKVAIGILIMQDIFAVLFLTGATGKIPSTWALALLGLPLLRPALFWLINLSGRGELFLLCGLFLALGVGAELFSLVGLKPDLGALVIGVLVASHPKASSLSKALLGFKELMLVGFFLSIGMQGLPSLEMLAAATLLCLFLPFKTVLYHLIVSRFGLRARTSLFSSLTLTNYSEFGLIVAAIAVSEQLLPPEWLLIIAMAVSLSFAFSAPLSANAERIYRRYGPSLYRLDRKKPHPQEAPIDPGQVKALVFGMGRIGVGAYEELRKHFGECICGVEHSPERVESNRAEARNVILGDALDTEFWLKLKRDLELELIILAMPNHQGNLFAAHQIRSIGFNCQVAAVARFPEEVEELASYSVCTAFNMYDEAGSGLAQHALEGRSAASRIYQSTSIAQESGNDQYLRSADIHEDNPKNSRSTLAE
ncbi:MAG: cation:proton antiporter [Desulfocapsaceae bacterium]|nr:cation:proton antiporter [Desulfocapsaceae bacterium]